MSLLSIRAENNFLNVFNNKGIIASVAEKALHNYASKANNNLNTYERLHYFAIGHTFKQLNKKLIFDIKIDEEKETETPTQFTSLLFRNFSFGVKDNLKILLENIRNINSHFLHDFEYLKVDKIDEKNRSIY
jgi:hypothetical protein